ncbi:MAG TPA: DinB family protein [Burkholderiales bacterium]
MSHHIFRIGEAFLETAADGMEYTAAAANVPPEEGRFTSGEEIAGYGASVARRIEQWWAGCADKACKGRVKTFFGAQPVHMLLERSAWHSAQHARQLIAVLERFGIEPQGRLTTEDLSGLPLPERLWD